MGRLATFFDKWINRASGFATVWPLVPSGALAVISGYLSTGVEWINRAGAWGWFTTGLVTFVVVYVGWALGVYVLARAKYLKVETVARERTIGDGSPFDPMARVFENKRLYLRDLAPLGRRAVNGKKFINCEIIGPGTAIIGMRSSETKPWPKMDNCHTDDVDCVQIAPTAQSRLAVSFLDCDFESCNFFQMTLLFYQRQNENLYWITPSADEPQLLLEGGKVDPSQ